VKARPRLRSRQTFRSLRSKNFLRYTAGSLVSSLGTWMATTSLTWLVLRTTDSGVMVGWTVACQYGPLLLIGGWAGTVVDRLDKRRLIAATSVLLAVQSSAVAVLVMVGATSPAWVLALTAVQGVVLMFDLPARRAFVRQLVQPADLSNAIGLVTTADVATRAVGPALAGLLVLKVGIAWCFWLNAASYLAMAAALGAMTIEDIARARNDSVGHRRIRAGLAYVRSVPVLRMTLVVTAAIGTIAFNFQINLAILARVDYGGGAGLFGLFNTLMGLGAIGGALWMSRQPDASPRLLMRTASSMGISMIAASAAPTLAVELIAIFACGVTSVAFFALAGALCMQATAPQFQGRIAALVMITFVGSAPVGGPLLGWISGAAGGRVGLLVGGVTCLAASAYVLVNVRLGRVSLIGEVLTDP
jgi:MFS family permease